VCFDRMELELGLEVTRAGKGGKVKLEVKKVAAGSMAGDGEVHVRDELVAYKAAGGAWHKVGFVRPTAAFMRDVIRLPRPLELRFRRGGHSHMDEAAWPLAYFRRDPACRYRAASARELQQPGSSAGRQQAGWMSRLGAR
jgi:hypothetical protein